MWQTVRRGEAARAGVRGAALVAIVLFTMLLGPSAAGAIVTTSTPVNTVAPSLTGTPTLGSTLSCSTGSWMNNPTVFKYAWLRDGSPIAGQTGSTYVVQAADQGHSISCQVTAGKSVGEYIISGLPTGSYKVQFYPGGESNGYLSQYYDGKSSEGEANVVSATAGSATAGIDAGLSLGGQISGKVTDTSHVPLAGILVCTRGSLDQCGSTNTAGEYKITSLPTGSYKVSFTGSGYLTQYYSGKSTESEAELVSVAAPGVTGAINAEMATGGRISGRVTDASTHADLAHIVVCTRGAVDSCESTNATGEYTISGLTSGSYKVEFYPETEGIYGEGSDDGGNYLTQYYSGKSEESEAESIPVSAPNATTGINAEMHAGGQISGKVIDATTHAALANISVCAYASSGSDIESCGSTSSAGEYTISSLPTGSYKVEFFSGYTFFFFAVEEGEYLSQYYNDKSSSGEAELVSVTAPGTMSGIDAEMRPGTQISGKVIDAATHAPLENLEVCASQAEAELFLDDHCTKTNGAGEYSIKGLHSGSYDVEFSGNECEVETCEEQNYLTQYYGGKSSRAEATPVAVAVPNATSGINAEMHVGAQIGGKVTGAAGAPFGGVEVCAENTTEHGPGGCVETNSGASSASVTSKALSVPPPAVSFSQAKSPVFDAKKGELDFFLTFSTAGRLTWSLFFRNADVGFADSLGISLGNTSVVAGVARKKGKAKAKKCKKGDIRYKHRCARVLVPFGSGSQTVPAGTVEVKVRASSKALKALRTGHTLHVSGTFTFQSALGGPPITHSVSTVVHPIKKPAKKTKKHKKR